MARGFIYLVAVADWHSRHAVASRLPITLEADFCVDALQEALGQGRPEVFNTCQGSPVHQPRVHPSPSAARGEDQHGRKGTLDRQHLLEAAVAHGEVRKGVPVSLPRREGGPDSTGRLLQVLQRPEAPSGPGVPDSGRGVPGSQARSHECSGGPVEGKEVFTGTGVGTVGRSEGTLT